MERKNINSNTKKIKRAVCGIMAGVLALSTVGYITLSNSKEVKAKETLDSIRKVVNSINDRNHYRILEVVPDNVSYAVSVNDVRDRQHAVSGNQIMGFTGYYIGGQEPVRGDIRNIFNDTLEEEIDLEGVTYHFTESQLADSHMRYVFANDMFTKLHEGNILNSGNAREIMTAPGYRHGDEVRYGAYYEVREGEISSEDLQRRVERGELTELYKDYTGEERLKDEAYKGEDPAPYIDEVRGAMTPSISGNYIINYDMTGMSEEADDIAADMIGSYLNDSSISEEPILEYEKHSLVYKSAFNEERKYDEEKFLGRDRGFFDPRLDHVDAESSASISANTVAVLGRNEGARCGYVVVSNTKADSEHIPAIGTPLYVHVDDGNTSYFVYAGKYGSIEGFTLSANQARRDTGVMTASIEAHPNTIALSAGPRSYVYEEFLNDEDDLDIGSNVDDLGAEGDDVGDGERIDSDPEDAGDDDQMLPDKGDTNETADPTDPADPTIPTDAQNDYFMLNFAYEENYNSFEVYYTVLDFYSSDQGDAEYYISPDKPELVNSGMGRGCIGLIENPEQSDLDYFVFDYAKNNGTHLFEHTPYTDGAYEDAYVYRIRGAKIYYGLNLTNNDWFKQYALDREPEECASLPIEVETRRISDLTVEDVMSYDMIIVLSGDNTLCLGEEYDDYAKTYNDFDTDVYAKIIERVSVEKVPVIGDYGIIRNGNPAIPGSWISDFVQVLMLKPSNATQTESGFSIYYDAIKLLDLNLYHFDVMDTTGASLYTENDNHFVNQNAYVFNMKNGQDYLGLLNSYFYSMASLNRNTIEGFGTEEVNRGFKEVLDDINSENNYRMVDVSEGNDPVLLDTYITEATAIRYIIGFSNKREKNIKGTLRILEIEPSCSFDLYIKDNSYPEERTNCNSYGMAGNSYSTVNGYSSGTTNDTNNKILYRNGTYKEITDSNQNLQSDGIVYKRSEDTWKDTSVSLDAAHSFIKMDGINIELTRMSIAEFIGHVEDLNSDYDVIYFGMNIQMLNTADNAPNNNYVQKRDGKNVTTRYNDSRMDGLVYTNIGDKKKVQPVLISDESHMYSTDEAAMDSNAERYSGNDLDNESVKRLTQFVDAGYPIILADKFYENASAEKESRKVNTNQVDSASYMHQFINNIVTKKTVYSVTDVKNDKSDKEGFFVWLLNLAKPEIVIKPETPAAESMKELSPNAQELSADTFEMYGYELTPDNFDGMFHLPFEFSIKNIGAASSNSKYTTQLFVDLNADGKYSPREKMDFSAVRENGSTVNEDGTGMRVGYDYYAECKLANTYDGVIPWRLIVYQEGHPERRSNATGYFTLRKDEPLHIKILQLNTRKTRSVIGGSTPATSWNMEKTAYKNGKYRQNDNDDIDKQIPYVNRLNVGHNFGDLLAKISPYYELEIRTIESDEWETEVAKDIDSEHPDVNAVSVNQYYEALRRYDMIIVGFADCCQGPVTENANEAIEKFISSERSVLFTHDTTSYINYDYNVHGRISGSQPTWYWGYYFNKHVRNIAGMDRYAIMAGARPDDMHPYSVAYVPKSGKRTGPAGNSEMSPEAQVLYTRGITNGEMNQRTGNNTYTNIRGIITNNGQDGGGSTAGNDDARGNTVTQVNDGQITKFPFALHKSFTVTPTHFQYYQLDLTDDEDKDGEKDICVWYCISDAPNRSFSQGGGGDMYEMTPNDVLNNYYIYNKGNVVYTGVGHRSVCDDNGDAFMKNRGKIRSGNYNLGEKPNAGMVNNIDEMKLFINTMVAAYQRGIREPNLKVVRSFTDSSATGSVYVSYDQSIPGITGGSESAVLDDDVSIFFNASRSNFVTSDERLKNDLRIKLYYEATEAEYNAHKAVQLPQFSREYDIPNWDPVNNPVELYEAEKHYYQNEDDSETGIYGIPIEISNAEYYEGGSKITRSYKLDEPLLGALPINGSSVDYGEYLADDRIYKLTVGGVQDVKSNRTDGSDGEDLWYEYETGVESDSIRGKSLNNRRIILMLTNDTYNGDTDVGREESTIQYVTLTRAKMFTLY